MHKLTEAEWTVLEALWNSENPAGNAGSGLGDLVAALHPSKKWSRNTVHTYLTRMEGKGLVHIDRSSEPHIYSALVTKEDCARQERNTLLNRVYGGAAGDLVAAFLKESHITSEERDALKKLLDEMEV